MDAINFSIIYNADTKKCNIYPSEMSKDTIGEERIEARKKIYQAISNNASIIFHNSDGQNEIIKIEKNKDKYELLLTRLGIIKEAKNYLPNELLQEIFPYLSPEDRVKSGFLSTEERKKISFEENIDLQNNFEALVIQSMNYKKISLSEFGLNEEQLKDILSRNGHSITRLDLSGLHIKNPLKLIKLCPKLEHLSLASQGITSKEVEELAALKILEGLRTQDLSDNSIGDEGAKALAAVTSIKVVW